MAVSSGILASGEDSYGVASEVTRTEREFGLRAQASFEEGLRQTIQWYHRYRHKQDRDNV